MTTIALLFLLAACDGDKPGGDDGTTGDGGTTDGGTVTEQGWCGVLQVIEGECALCHNDTAPAGELDLETDPHAALVGQESSLYAGQVLVVAGDADASFIITKISATQTADQGDPMPPSGDLDAASVQVVRDWIDSGAGSDCDDPGDSGTADYHPDGYDDPAVHGLEAKLHEQTCTDCHGADLAGGSGASCDSCHEAGWRTECTYCHGGLENGTGAPPEDIDDATTDAAFGAHGRHVEENNHAAFDCTQCHLKPIDVLSYGHLFDATAGQAEVTLAAGLSGAGSWDAGARSCSDLYCHGDGRADNGTVSVDDAPLACNDCHPDRTSGRDRWDDMSGEHGEHLEEGVGCQECHHATTADGSTIADPAPHVDGDVDVELSEAGISWNGSACSGACHGEDHRGEAWR